MKDSPHTGGGGIIVALPHEADVARDAQPATRPLETRRGAAGHFVLHIRCVFFLLGADSMLKFWKNLTGPCGAPTYLPTYLPYLWETKKEITVWVKVGYYTN